MQLSEMAVLSSAVVAQNRKGGYSHFSCQYIVSPRGQTGNRTDTQMRHPLLVEGRPNCARESLASAVSAPRVAATSYCHRGRHANVVTPFCLFLFKNMPKMSSSPNVLNLDGCCSSAKPYHFHRGSLLWTGPQ